MAYTYKYPRPAVTADCIVITREAEPKVLLIQRGDQPFKGGWAFPGGLPHLAFDHYDIMQDAIQKYKEIVK